MWMTNETLLSQKTGSRRIKRFVIHSLALALAAGCRSGDAEHRSNVSPSLAFPPELVRVVNPFEVLDEAGTRYAHPTLGGLNVPRPQFIDIDHDGDLDLFIQERSGQIMFFEHVAGLDATEFVWRTDHYQGLDVGEWYRFVDMDDDGDYDLLAEEPFSHIRYYRNDGTPGEPSFTLAADTLRDPAGKAIFSDRQNIPNVTDIDCDGMLDLFLGRLDGTVSRYEERGVDENGVPRFRLVADRFEMIEIVARIGSRHGANTIAFEDVDHDGDQDLFWGDFFEPGLLFIENRGSCTSPMLRGEPVAFPLERPLKTSGYNAPTFGDVDGDGDLDLLVGVLGGAFNPNLTAADNLLFFEGDADGTFTQRTARYLSGIDIGSESIPALVDLDGDGDLDLLLSNKIDPANLRTSRVYRFENQGTPHNPSFRLTGTLNLSGSYHYAPTFGDLDGDGDVDMLLGSWSNDVAFLRNTGTTTEPEFVLEDSTFVSLTRGSNSTPTLGDLDGDGDLDLFVGEASGTLNYYRNDGTPQSPNFVLVSDRYNDIDVGRRSFPTLVDLDRDGDLDLVVGTAAGELKFFRNVGTPQAAEFVPDPAFTFTVGGYATPVFADIDGDGDLDLFSGGIGGGLLFFENRTAAR